MVLDEQLISINSSTRNLVRRASFLKTIDQYILIEQITKNLTPPKDLQDKILIDIFND